jgi:ABC-type antimicrobial peptide transport system permease subunit
VGILKALGFSITDILEVRLLECIVLGLFSASVGIFLSILFDVYLGAPVISDFMLGWASVYPEFPLPVMIKLDTVATLYAVAVFPLLLGSLTPSWYSAIEEPDVAIRGV